MAVIRWNPWRETVTLREATDRLLEDSLVRPRRVWEDGSPERAFRLPLDVYTTPEEIVVTAAFPGLTPDEVDISIEGDVLTIRGEMRAPLENVDYLLRERPYGTFSRRLTLNVPVDAVKAEAVFENGVLEVTLPRAEADKPRKIAIQAG